MADESLEKKLTRTPEQILPVEESGLEADRKAFERSPESKDVFLEQPIPEEDAPVSKIIEGQPTTARAVPQAPADEVTVEVEKIMEEGLGEFFTTMPPEAKQKFKKKGEEVAKELSIMVRSFKVHFKRALQLIRDWLLTIPGVNKFFLEQEAKIKVDLIIALAEERKAEHDKQK
ncbi:MAG: hypothetical protein RDU25_03360 [Patescibacteria group bacterium]|nr:hypothetical protein [Patescibacteria group bacterium]